MNMIVAVDHNWAIGYRNELFIRIPQDQKFFREETTGKVVVLGRKTLATFPQGLPLMKRKNIILSKDPSFCVNGAEVVHSLEELFKAVKEYDSKDVYVVGGDSVYRQLLPYCDVVHVTKIDHEYQADAWFPDLDESPDWQVTEQSDEQTYFDVEYQFIKYQRTKAE